MSLKWKNGRDLRRLAQGIQNHYDGQKDVIQENLEQAAEYGGAALQDLLEGAMTTTGKLRQKRGGLPGRHLTGNMVASVSFEARSFSRSQLRSVFGWWGANYEDYFYVQDKTGEAEDGGTLPPARALQPAAIAARIQFQRLMKRSGFRKR